MKSTRFAISIAVAAQAFALFLSTNASAENIRCTSTSRSSETTINLQGQASLGNTYQISMTKPSERTDLEIIINDIKPSENNVEINGFAKNLYFIGGGRMNVQLVLPMATTESAVLRMVTPVFNREAEQEEFEVNCQVQNLYQVFPDPTNSARM